MTAKPEIQILHDLLTERAIRHLKAAIAAVEALPTEDSTMELMMHAAHARSTCDMLVTIRGELVNAERREKRR